MERTKYLVVGAGVSGLAFADWCESDDYIVCEASSEPGGYCRTIHKAGFTWDYSGHFFHFRHPEIERYLVERMGSQRVRKIQKESRIYFAGGLIDFPFQKNIHQLPKEDFIDCLYDLYFKEEREPDNFQAMLYAKFGRSIAEKFLIPYNEKLYATDLSRLDVDAMGRFFPYADVDAIIRNFRQPDNASYNATFTYPEGGAIQYIDALRVGVPDNKIRLDTPVTRIDLERQVAHTPRGDIAFEFLVSTAPFFRLLELCGVDHDPACYSYNKVQVFNLGFDGKGADGIHWIYFPQRELSFYRIGFYDNIFGSDRMSLYVEIGLPPHATVDEPGSLERVMTDLHSCGIVGEQQLVEHHHVVLDPAYVHITQRSIADVIAKKAQLSVHGVHSIGRYGSWTYCSIEDNIVEARNLAESLA